MSSFTLEVIKVHEDGTIKTRIDFDGAEGGHDFSEQIPGDRQLH